MVEEYKNIPCVIKYNNTIFKTTKTASFFSKHKEMSDSDVEIFYIGSSLKDRAEIDKALAKLEADVKGIKLKEKEVFPEQRPYTHTYRIDKGNTLLCAYSEEELNTLKKWYGIRD